METVPVFYKSISDLYKMIRKKSISPVELIKIFIDRIDSLNSICEAYCYICRETAIQQAIASETAIYKGYDLGIFHGIPYAAKDLYDVEGTPTTGGSHLLNKNIAKKDATVIKRLKKSGMILLGKTKTVQFAYGGVGINHDQGSPLNPWKKEPYIAGGSSSGSGVSVSKGLSTMALGTDTGGSIRIPAALCGITGLKPTVGRISRAGIYPLSHTMDSFGPLCRNVEDAAFIYNNLQGEDINDLSTFNLPKVDVLKNLKKGIKGFTLAFANRVFWDDIHPDIEKNVRSTELVFRELGANVQEIDFRVAQEAKDLNSNSLVISAEACSVNEKWLRNHYDQLDPIVSKRMINGTKVSATEYLHSVEKWKELQSKAIEALDHIDALLVPTTCIPALPVHQIDKDIETYFSYNTLYLRNTTIGNILNLCAVSIPCGFTKDGLPTGLMIYGKPYNEDIILRIGYAFQKITTWHQFCPK
jgi:aspartyl-tRNA(Asn)/glutamyl-tRNA(Gln) amidotransferase subunit A